MKRQQGKKLNAFVKKRKPRDWLMKKLLDKRLNVNVGNKSKKLNAFAKKKKRKD